VRIAYASGALLSVFGSLFIILSFIIVKRLRTMTTFLVFMMGISCLGVSLFGSLSWFLYKEIAPGGGLDLSSSAEAILCQIQAGGIQFFAISSFFWISCLAFHAFNILCRKKNDQTLRSYFKYYFLICYLVPAITVVGCILTNSFGETEDNVWCWITQDQQQMRFIVYYIPLISMWLFNLGIYALLSRESQSSLSYGYILKEGKKRLRLYILIFVIAKSPALINRLCNVMTDRKVFALFLLQAIFDSLFGFFETVVFVALVRKRLPSFNCWKGREVELQDPLFQRDSGVPYSSIAERMYYSKKQSRPING